MGWFRKKKSGDFIDYTEMYRRGLLPPQKHEIGKDGVIDFSKRQIKSAHQFSGMYNQPSQSPIPQTTQTQKEDDPSGLNFLNNLASADSTNVINPITSQVRDASRTIDHESFNELKLKIDDNEYRIREMEAKIIELESQLKQYRGY